MRRSVSQSCASAPQPGRFCSAFKGGRRPGWRRSADRTGLQENSLLTGNFTGKFAISGLRDAPLKPKVAVLQRLLGQFPTGVNRENILKNREGFGGYQGIQLLQPRRHQNKLTSAVPLKADITRHARHVRWVRQKRTYPWSAPLMVDSFRRRF